MNHIKTLKQALDALEDCRDVLYQVALGNVACRDAECLGLTLRDVMQDLRAAIAQPESEPTIKESLKVHASAEDYLRYKYGAYRGHHAWRELEEAYSQGRYDESMAQGPSPWPDDLNQQPVHRPGTVGIDE